MSAPKAEGRKPESVHHQAYEMAMGEYLRHFEGEKPRRLIAAKFVSEMNAAAINADPEWFWSEPNR
jgi:hypothetical protein